MEDIKIISIALIFVGYINYLYSDTLEEPTKSSFETLEPKRIQIFSASYGFKFGKAGVSPSKPKNEGDFERLNMVSFFGKKEYVGPIDVKSIIEKELIEPAIKEGKVCLIKKGKSKTPLSSSWMDKTFGDPTSKLGMLKHIRAAKKFLYIIYGLSSQKYYFGDQKIVNISENEDLILPLTSGNGFLEIISANYGTNEKNIDVTAKLKNLVADNDCYIMPKENGWMNKIFSDPAVKKDKRLVINYKFKGNSFKKTVKEDDSLLLPNE